MKTRTGALAPVGIMGKKEEDLKYLKRLLPGITVGKLKLCGKMYYTFVNNENGAQVELLCSSPLDEVLNNAKACLL